MWLLLLPVRWVLAWKILVWVFLAVEFFRAWVFSKMSKKSLKYLQSLNNIFWIKPRFNVVSFHSSFYFALIYNNVQRARTQILLTLKRLQGHHQEVPGHHQEQLTQILFVHLLKMHALVFIVPKKLGVGGGSPPRVPVLHFSSGSIFVFQTVVMQHPKISVVWKENVLVVMIHSITLMKMSFWTHSFFICFLFVSLQGSLALCYSVCV